LASNWKYFKYCLKSWKRLLNSYCNVKWTSTNISIEKENILIYLLQCETVRFLNFFQKI
jgi:hypothetical protein